MTADVTVSVVVPAYNTAALIGTTIDSILAQTYTSYEIIVVNDHSPDTAAMEQALAPYRDRINYLVHDANYGLSVTRNRGIRFARGRYIALLDSDDAWEPEYLAEQLAIMESDPTLAAVYSDARIVGNHPHAGRTFMEVCPSRGEVTFESVLNSTCTVFVSVLARREALCRVGLFNERLRSAEDFELWLRLLASGARIAYHRRVLVRHLKRGDSLSADPIWMTENALKSLAEVANLDLPAEARAMVAERQQYLRARLELARGKHAFFRLDTSTAIAHLDRANQFFGSRRLRIVSALMKTFPGALLRAYRLRDRFVVGADTSF